MKKNTVFTYLVCTLVLSMPACSQPVRTEAETKPGDDRQAQLAAEKMEDAGDAADNGREQLPGSEEMEFSVEYLMGQFDPAKHPDFESVDTRYSDGDPYFLRRETYESFRKMWEAARADGVNLKIISATRNFYRQKAIWEAKWTGSRKIENGRDASVAYPDPATRALAILKYSSMPGTSHHHWGTDIDINDLENDYFESGEGKKVYDWMTTHAADYGFCQPYTEKGDERPYGYEEEKWHWSYIPVAGQLTRMAADRLRNSMIGGFKGAETAGEINVVEKYVLGINPDCKN